MLDGTEIVNNYLGKLINVGTWQERWNTLGHFSQQSSLPPFWHTAHQSSLGSSSFLPSPAWEDPIHPVFPGNVFSSSTPGWSSVLSGASVLRTASSEVELWLVSSSKEVSMDCRKKQRKSDYSIYVNLRDPNNVQTDLNNRLTCQQLATCMHKLLTHCDTGYLLLHQ